MPFLSEGVKSPCPRRVLKILVLSWRVKKCKFLSVGGSQEKVSEGGNIFRKMTEGVKIVKKKWVKKAVQGG